MNRLYTDILSVVIMAFIFIANPSSGEAQTNYYDDYNILCLGNSITAGEYGGSASLSYRYHFWKNMVSGTTVPDPDVPDFSVNMVGSFDETTGSNPGGTSNWPTVGGLTFDPDHEGHPQWRADYLLIGDPSSTAEGNISSWAVDYVVDIALIHIGTNDVLDYDFDDDGTIEDYSETTVQDIKGMMRILRAYNPRVSIYVAKIIPMNETNSHGGVPEHVDYQNDAVEAAYLAGEFDDANFPNSACFIVDCNTPIDPTPVTGDLLDGVHPTVNPDGGGEKIIGETFYDAVTANLPVIKHKWTGATNSNWTTGSNWNLGTVPTATDDVVILASATNWPTFGGDFLVGSHCRDFVMEASSQMTVDGDFFVNPEQFVSIRGNAILNISGDFSNAGEGFRGGGLVDFGTTTQYKKQGNYLEFDVTEAFELVSVKVRGKDFGDDNNTASEHTIYWATSDETVQEQITVMIQPGAQRIDLNFTIPIGTDHQLGLIVGDVDDILIKAERDPDGLPYPYAIGEVGSITGTSVDHDWYWYFFDWEYKTPGLIAPTIGLGMSDVNFNGASDNVVKGPPNSFGGARLTAGAVTNFRNRKFLEFDCFHPFVLHSVWVNAAGTDDIEVYWSTIDGNPDNPSTWEESRIISITSSGWQRIELEFNITPGIHHELGISAASEKLERDHLVGSIGYDLDYPFLIGNVGAINPVLLSRRGYNCFYDWEFTPAFHDVNVNKTGNSLATDGDMGVNNDITIQEGTFFTVDADDKVNIGNDLYLLADATSIASLLNNGTMDVKGMGRVDQYLSNDVWHYVSSPISDGLSGVYTDVYVNWWEEATNTWTPIVAVDVPLVSMQGYAAWHYTTPFTASYAGTLNNGAQSIGVTNQWTGTDPGYNLVGNPYPSSMDWDAASGWTKTNVDNTIYFWSGVGGGGGGNYHYYVGTGGSAGAVGIGDGTNIIPPGQGFMVMASSATGTLGVTNDVRVHNPQSFYKAGQAGEVPMIRLQARDMSNNIDETVVRFVEESTIEHDGQYDAYKLYGSNFPQLFTYTNTKTELAINSLPDYDPSTVIPMGFTAPEDGDYSITLTAFDNFDDGSELFIEDLLTNQVQNLSQNPVYKLQSDVDDDPNRFLLYFAWTTDVEEELESPLYIYSYENNVVVKLPLDNERAFVEVFDLMGKQVYSGDFSGQTKAVIPVIGEMGHYVVKVQTVEEFHTETVFIK